MGEVGCVGLGCVGEVVPSEVRSSARRVRSRRPPLTPAYGQHRCFGFATVQGVRHALADIDEGARCPDERLAVRTPSCGSRRERFAARRVGEHVSSDVSLCTSYQS